MILSSLSIYIVFVDPYKDVTYLYLMEYLSGANMSEKQLIHMLSNRAMDPKELNISRCACVVE